MRMKRVEMVPGMGLHPNSRVRNPAPVGCTLVMLSHGRREPRLRWDEEVVAALGVSASFGGELFHNLTILSSLGQSCIVG